MKMGIPNVNIFPDGEHPTCWSDDVRMNALFAPFRLKAANPESWEMKVKFWSDMLKQWCRLKNDPVLSANEARLAFQRKGRTPACIEIVVEECLHKGELSLVSKYLQILHHGPESWLRWGARLAFKPAALAVTTLSLFLPFKQSTDQDGLPKASIDPKERFVMESAVKEQATLLLSDYPSDVERFGTIEELMMNTKFTNSQRETFEILIGYLISQGQAAKKGNIIKLAADPGQKAVPIQESDETLHRLLASERKLMADVEKFTKEADRALEEARVAMKLGNKVAAKNHLSRKHRCLQKVVSSENTLENVRHLMHTMRQTEVNATVVDTYRISAETMKRGMQVHGLNEDTAHDTMDQLKEVLDTWNEVEKALSGNIDDSNIEDLENELKELMTQPASPPGGNVSEQEKEAEGPSKPSPQQTSNKKVSERDFIFDGEERMMAELNNLSVEDGKPQNREKGREGNKEKIAVPIEEWQVPASSQNKEKPSEKKKKEKPSKPWYPPQNKFLTAPNNPWQDDEDDNLDKLINELYDSYKEIQLDDRLHPGQKLDPDYRTGRTRLYNKDFQVQDHKVVDDIWLYNCRDGNQNLNTKMANDLTNSTEYPSNEPSGSSIAFQMAPGGERNRDGRSFWPDADTGSDADTGPDIEDLERRLKDLRGSKS